VWLHHKSRKGKLTCVAGSFFWFEQKDLIATAVHGCCVEPVVEFAGAGSFFYIVGHGVRSFLAVRDNDVPQGQIY